MDQTTREQLEQKAPLVDPDGLVDTIESEILSPELRDRGSSIWLRGSFVDPDREIDSGEKYSDMDVYVPVDGWDLPLAGPGTIIYASQTDSVHAVAVAKDEYEWSYKHQWESADRAYERLPEYAIETFTESLRHFFIASEEDKEADVYRQYDIRIGSPSQVDLFPYATKVRDL